MSTDLRPPLASSSAAGGAAPSATRTTVNRPQATQWRATGSRQMGGVWNTNRYFVRRQFS